MGGSAAPRPGSELTSLPQYDFLSGKLVSLSAHVLHLSSRYFEPRNHHGKKAESKDSYPRFTEKTEAQRGEMTHPADKETRARTQIFWPQA